MEKNIVCIIVIEVATSTCEPCRPDYYTTTVVRVYCRESVSVCKWHLRRRVQGELCDWSLTFRLGLVTPLVRAQLVYLLRVPVVSTPKIPSNVFTRFKAVRNYPISVVLLWTIGLTVGSRGGGGQIPFYAHLTLFSIAADSAPRPSA